MVRWFEEKLRFVKYRAGSALVLVIVITVLLATVGVMFVMMARVSQVATSAISDNRELSAAVDVVVNRIHTVLVDDLFGSDDNMFNGPGDSDSLALGDEDEYYDYPGPDDPWLASLEPYEFAPDYYWGHISDIYGIMGGWDNIFDLEAVIAVEPTDVNDSLFEGIPADADGDGVTDSRWLSLPVTSSRGRPIFAAVRIIDNCGMININTAYRDPTGSPDPCDWPDWDGSLLTHINLDTDRIHNALPVVGSYYGFVSFQDSGNLLSTAELHRARCGVPLPLPLPSDTTYHDDVARRLLNPEFGYVPFDIGDELEFRNRFFLSTTFIPPGVVTRSGLVWPATLDPQANPGRGTPFGTRPTDTIRDWFLKVTSPEISADPCENLICNRRHIATTYSFDRILRPYDDTPLPGEMADTSGQRKFGIQLPLGIANGSASDVEKEQYIRQLAGAIYRGLPANTVIDDWFGPDYTRETLSWQFAVNLIDYQDNDNDDPCDLDPDPDNDEPTYYDAAGAGEFWGVENVECIKRDTIFISEVAYVNFDSGGAPPPPSNGEYFAIELFNPDTQPKQPWSTQDYYIVIAGGPPISLDDASIGPLPSEEAVVLTNAVLADVPLIFPTLVWPGRIFEVPGLDFAEGNEIVIYKEDWPPGSGADMPVDRIEVPPLLFAGAGINERRIRARNQTLGPIEDNLLWTGVGVDMAWMWADSSGVPDTLGAPPDTVESDPNMHVQLAVTNESLRTIGEIENVFAVGYDPNHSLIGSIEAIYGFGSTPELGLDMRRYGRIDLSDPNYWPLLDYLTCFDPSNDGVDNNGNGRSDDPANDGVDNDGDGLIDGGDPDETFANFGERTELAVAGRININTAPWFVIKHLPWLGLNTDGTDTDNLAQAIVAWRDRLNLTSMGGPDYWSNTRSDVTGLTEISEEPGFRSIAELLQVINEDMTLPEFDIRKYLDGVNNYDTPISPDYSLDITDDDFEERDIIFQRISNLVTVRSDVFTAYILVRIGHDGPQKRMIAIFDRSNVFSPADKPRLVALHPVPDPR